MSEKICCNITPQEYNTILDYIRNILKTPSHLVATNSWGFSKGKVNYLVSFQELDLSIAKWNQLGLGIETFISQNRLNIANPKLFDQIDEILKCDKKMKD